MLAVGAVGLLLFTDVRKLRTNLSRNVPFLKQMFNEGKESLVKSAKEIREADAAAASVKSSGSSSAEMSAARIKEIGDSVPSGSSTAGSSTAGEAGEAGEAKAGEAKAAGETKAER